MKRSRVHLWRLLCLAMCTVSCVTVGKEFDTTHVNDVRRGQSRTEIVHWFGEPASGNKFALVESSQRCVKRYRYNFADREASYVLWIDFDASDQVCNTVYSRT
jgi:outer membrane protein assembly factor BamE (lipoprotein component of BamABCDE complex)